MFKFFELRKSNIKELFQSYYILYGIILVVFIQNISRLAFLACHNFQHMFFLSTKLYLTQAITFIFVGIIVILSVSFYYIIHFLYGKFSKFIPVNIRRIREQPMILLFHCVIRPVIEVSTNAFFF